MNFVIKLSSFDKLYRQSNLIMYLCTWACHDGKSWHVGFTAKGTPRQGFGGSSASFKRLCGQLCTKGWMPPVQFILTLYLNIVVSV